jgi:hypothetical protein
MTTPPRGRLQAIFPALDDIRKGDALERYDIWSDEPIITNDTDSARYWAAKHGEALQTIQDLRSDLSAARFERSVWWPLAFAVGVLCGMGLSWWM